MEEGNFALGYDYGCLFIRHDSWMQCNVKFLVTLCNMQGGCSLFAYTACT